jgi:hypothetical protein
LSPASSFLPLRLLESGGGVSSGIWWRLLPLRLLESGGGVVLGVSIVVIVVASVVVDVVLVVVNIAFVPEESSVLGIQNKRMK